MASMQAAALWSLLAAIVLAAGAALLWQRQLLREAREREQCLQRQVAHASSFALAGQIGAATLQEVSRALGNILLKTGATQALLPAGDATASPFHALVADLRTEAQLTRDSVRRLLALLEPRPDGHERFDLHAMLAEVQHILAPEARRRRMEIVLQPCASQVVVSGARLPLQLLVLQLLTNAMDACENTPAAQRRILLSTHDDRGDVHLCVSDRGHGFGGRRPETLFAPYYTTREGRMGLGLSVARSIAQAHGGRIEARRRAGGGAVFTLALPARAPASVAARAPAAAPVGTFGPSCVV